MSGETSSRNIQFNKYDADNKKAISNHENNNNIKHNDNNDDIDITTKTDIENINVPVPNLVSLILTTGVLYLRLICIHRNTILSSENEIQISNLLMMRSS